MATKKRVSRKPLGKKLRFEVFKRDKFTCQYCGSKAPDVVLVVDHIRPVAKGGENELLNLTTSCQVCNSGKGSRELDDSSSVEKQRRQLEDLQERRDQLDMMLAWKKDLQNLDDHALSELASHWSRLVPGWSLNDAGLRELRKLIRSFGAPSVMDAMRIATTNYLSFSGGNKEPTRESVGLAWMRVGGIAKIEQETIEKPYLHNVYNLDGQAEAR